MTRIKAALSHLLVSIIIFSVVIAVLLFIWYPPPYFTASGGWQGLKIAAGVDLVLGPLLTLIIFDITKSQKKLVGDLIVIALLQFTALTWGVHTIYSQRPVAVVFWEHEFMTVPAKVMEEQQVDLDTLDRFGIQKPPFIYAEKPKELEALKAMAKRIKETHVPPHHDLLLYKPLAEFFDDVLPYQLNMDNIVEHNSEVKDKLDSILAETNKKREDYYYFSLRSKYHNIILLFSHDGQLENHIVVKL